MKTAFVTLLGFILGSILGVGIGIVIGLLAVELFKISSFEGASGYAVVFWALVGLLLGGIGGGVLFYKIF